MKLVWLGSAIVAAFCAGLHGQPGEAQAASPALNISRGSTFHYIDFPSQSQASWARIRPNLAFLPPGTFFLRLGRHQHEAGRILIRTEDGITGYLRDNPSLWIGEEHFLTMLELAENAGHHLGVVRRPFVVEGLEFSVGEGPFRVTYSADGGEDNNTLNLFICSSDELSDKWNHLTAAPGGPPRARGEARSEFCEYFSVDERNISVLLPRDIGVQIETQPAVYWGSGLRITNVARIFPPLVLDDVFSHQKRCGNAAPISISETRIQSFEAKLKTDLGPIGAEFGYKGQIATQVTQQFQYDQWHHVDEKMYFFAESSPMILYDRRINYRSARCDESPSKTRHFVVDHNEIDVQDIITYAKERGIMVVDGEVQSIILSNDDEFYAVRDFLYGRLADSRANNWMMKKVYKIEDWESFVNRHPVGPTS